MKTIYTKLYIYIYIYKENNYEQHIWQTWNIYEMMFIFWGVLPATWKYEANLKKNVNKYKHIICKLLFWSLGLGWAGQRCLGPQKYGTRINKKTTHNTKHTLLSVYNKHICAKIYVAASGYADTYLFMHRNWYFHNTYQYLCINNDILTTHVFVCMQVIGLVKM